MTQLTNRKLLLTSRPVGFAGPDDFRLVEEPVGPLADGEVLVRNLYLSMDPTNRVWMSDMEQYMPPVEVGQTMRGIGLGQVVASKDPAYAAGDFVQGMIGWQDYWVSRSGPFAAFKLPKEVPVPLTAWLGPLCLTGYTAYIGLLDFGQPKAGETVLVSAAAGATGSVVGQIAKIKGCRVVGIAGTDEKCAWLTGELGFDAAINYKKPGFRDALRTACPDGVDIHFENVGGSILDDAISVMNHRGRIVLCGLISTYNATEPPPGPSAFGLVLMRRLRIQGFIVTDHADRFAHATEEIAGWMAQGWIKTRDTVVDGLENAPSALNLLFTGGNTGKLYVKIADPA